MCPSAGAAEPGGAGAGGDAHDAAAAATGATTGGATGAAPPHATKTRPVSAATGAAQARTRVFMPEPCIALRPRGKFFAPPASALLAEGLFIDGPDAIVHLLD